MKKKILLTISALAITIIMSAGISNVEEVAASENDGSINFMYQDPDIKGFG